MLFSKNDERANERVLYKTKPNMILGCKKVIYGVVLLVIVFSVSPMIIQFIGKMQVYLISRIQLPLTSYTAIAFFVVILVIVLYMIWQLLSWYSIEYTLTDTRIIIKSGVLSSKKNYMPYTTIQDVNTSQSIFARLFNVGTVSTFSAYDNNQIKLENISDPSKVEDIIFSSMMNYRSFNEPPRAFINRQENNMGYSERFHENNFSANDDYYDEYEPITPISHERNVSPRREYEYYPENFDFDEDINRYEYEPYDDDLDYNMNRVMDNSNDAIMYEGQRNGFPNESYYDEVRDNYSNRNDDYSQNYGSERYYNEGHEKTHHNDQEQVDDSSETVIRRHFDKFKK